LVGIKTIASVTAACILSMIGAVQPCQEDDFIQLLQYGPAVDSGVFTGGPARSELSSADNVAILWHLI